MKAIPKKLAAKRLCKKLSALRATLPNAEREMLDNLVVVDEVAAERIAKIIRPQIRFDPSREEYQLIEPY